jgi:hypothetical protein
VYPCNHYLKATKCDKYKINTGYYMLHGIFHVQSSIRYVDNSQMAFYLHGPELASYPVKDYLGIDLHVWPLPLRYGSRCCAWHIVLLLWTFVQNNFKIPWSMICFLERTQIYPLQTIFIFDLQLWHWPWRYESGFCTWLIVLLLWTFVPYIYKIPWSMKKL